MRLAKSGSELSADRILVATGGAPYLPEGLPGVELGHPLPGDTKRVHTLLCC